MRNVVACTVLLVVLAFSAVAQDLPARPTRLLTDKAGILANADAEEIERHLGKLSRYGLAQAIVYIDKKVPSGAEFEPYTLKMANSWGVGSAEKNDGVVIFIYTDPLQMRIEAGKGLEHVLTNDVTQSIVENELRPAFNRKHYGFGLVRAIDTITRTLDTARALKEQEARKAAKEAKDAGKKQ